MRVARSVLVRKRDGLQLERVLLLLVRWERLVEDDDRAVSIA